MRDDQPARILVLKSGWLATVQDLGRYGHQQYGVSVSGAMDPFSTIVANRLVGNPDQAAVLELTLKGPELQFERDTVIAITGADLSPSINGHHVPMWESIAIQRGNHLSFGMPRTGSRAYLAIAGGIEVPLVLGSRSTHCASKIGGLHGTPLKPGDVFYSGTVRPFVTLRIGTRFPAPLRPHYERSASLRVIPGPQLHFFGNKALTTLMETIYTVSPESDRMGYRLAGSTLIRKGSSEFISDGTVMGALQVPSNGQPILLMADRQTTGGYPKIAVVISADLPLAAQLAPGDRITFTRCTVSQAQTVRRSQRARLDARLPPCTSSSQLIPPLNHYESF